MMSFLSDKWIQKRAYGNAGEFLYKYFDVAYKFKIS